MDGDDLAIGIPAIAAAIPTSQKTTERLIRGGDLPVFRLGGRWAMRPSRWRETIRQLEDAAAAERRTEGLPHQ